MADYFRSGESAWTQTRPGVLFRPLHRYPNGGGAGLFKLRAGAEIPEHDHPTGEHGYVISGTGYFADQKLSTGDAFWVPPGETHAVRAETDLQFFATSLPRSGD